jgi:cytochrome d ubiquinol oxidase subunit II
MDLFPLAWAAIIAFAIVMYVVLDGVTLGTAMLLPFLNEEERDLAVSVILPTWDGNQTWLVLGAACLYGAFPVAFSAILPVFYIPLLVMVVALLFRGVVFEFRLKDRNHIKYWDIIFTVSSIVVTVIQGVVLASFVQGLDYGSVPYLVSKTNLLTWFALFVSFCLIIGYCLLGATRLIYKTEGSLQAKMYKIAPIAGLLVMFGIGIVSLWTPFANPAIYTRWFANQNWLLLGILPYLAGISFLLFLYAIKQRDESLPYLCAVSLFIYSYIGFIIGLYPYIVPYKMTIWEAAAPTSSLYFMMVGALIMLPILLIYTAYSYRIFKGKVKNVFHY